jgi:hypothetical protein
MQFIVKGSVRGSISKHRSLKAAVKSLVEDNQDCEAFGWISDVCVYVRIDNNDYLVPLDINERDGTFQFDEWAKTVPKSVRRLVEKS